MPQNNTTLFDLTAAETEPLAEGAGGPMPGPAPTAPPTAPPAFDPRVMLALALQSQQAQAQAASASRQGQVDDAGRAALMSTVFGSPFYQGQPSNAGPVGQVSQAILPLILGLQARRQARSEAELAQQQLVQAKQKEQQESTYKKIQALNLYSQINERQNKTQREKELLARLDAHPNLKLTGAKVGGFSFSDPNKKSSTATAIEQLAAAVGKSSTVGPDTSIIKVNGKDTVFQVHPDGTMSYNQFPSTSIETVRQKIEALDLLDDYSYRMESLIEQNPEAGTSVSQWTNVISGLGYNISSLANQAGLSNITDFFQQTFKPGNLLQDFPGLALEDNEGNPINWADSKWYQSLYSPGTDHVQQLQALMLYKAAEAQGQTGRAISDADLKYMERIIIPGGWGVWHGEKIKEDMKGLRANNQIQREHAARSAEQFLDPNSMFRTSIPSTYRIDFNKDTKVTAFGKYFDFLTGYLKVPREVAGKRAGDYIKQFYTDEPTEEAK